MVRMVWTYCRVVWGRWARSGISAVSNAVTRRPAARS
jgi:hypothetical protein